MRSVVYHDLRLNYHAGLVYAVVMCC